MQSISTYFRQFSSSTCARAIARHEGESMLAAAGNYRPSLMAIVPAVPAILLTGGIGLVVAIIICYIKSYLKEGGWAVLGPLIATHRLEGIEGEGDDVKHKLAFMHELVGDIDIRDLTNAQSAQVDFSDVEENQSHEMGGEAPQNQNKKAISIKINGIETIVKGITVIEMQKQIREDLFNHQHEEIYLKFLEPNDTNLKKALAIHKFEVGNHFSEQEKINRRLDLSTDELRIVSANCIERLSKPEEVEDMSKAAAALQKFIRSYNVVNIKEPFADVAALRNTAGEAIAYKILPNDGDQFAYVAFPKEATANQQKGSYKTLTHRTAKSEKDKHNYVGLTLENSCSKTMHPRFLTIISEHKLDKIKPQIRVNESQLIAEDLGQFDLHDQVIKKQYAFNPNHFKDLASNIDILHSLNIVHRDIKLSNMFFTNGEVYLSDLDSMGEVGTFKSNLGTRGYWAPAFVFNSFTVIHDNADKDQPINAYKRDQCTFFIAMIMACLSTKPQFGQFKDHEIDAFLKTMPCNNVRKDELKLFLLDPKNNELSSSLANYLENSDAM